MHAIVLAAGRGTRMWPVATTAPAPKPLLEVAGRSLLHRMLDGLAAAGCKAIVVVTPPGKNPVRRHALAWRGKAKVRCVAQSEPKGTGHAVAAGAKGVKQDAIVAMADCLVPTDDLASLVRGKGFLLLGAEVPDGSRYGVLKARAGRLVSLREKPKGAGPALVNTGLYRVPVEALRQARDLAPSPRGELEFTDVVAAWARRPGVRVVRTRGWLDVGAPWDLLEAAARLVPAQLDATLKGKRTGGAGTVEAGVQVRGRLFVSEDAVVKSGTYVEGDAWVGPGSTVGPNAYLRGPVSIGAGCKVGAATEVKASVLLDGAKAPHLSYVGDSVLGAGCNLGAGTVVANLRHDEANVRVTHRGAKVDTGRKKLGAIVGDGAKTGINASLNPGTILGPGVLVDAGAFVRGTVESGRVRRD